jgi:hypothetical protein
MAVGTCDCWKCAVSVKIPNGTGDSYYRNDWSPWFREVKMNRRAFVSINRMTAGHTSLKASLNRLTFCPRLNANVVMGCKPRNVSSGIINCTRTNGQQWWAFCLRTWKWNTKNQLQNSSFHLQSCKHSCHRNHQEGFKNIFIHFRP